VLANTDPIIPTVTEQPTYSNMGFQTPSYESLVNCWNSSLRSTVLPSQLLGQNAVYIGFLFPGQFL
jgi:hypothetical protein